MYSSGNQRYRIENLVKEKKKQITIHTYKVEDFDEYCNIVYDDGNYERVHYNTPRTSSESGGSFFFISEHSKSSSVEFVAMFLRKDGNGII
jgi:hypothetical protein